MLPRKIAAGMRILRGPLPIIGCLTATLGLLVLGYPLPPSAVGSLLGWVVAAFGIPQLLSVHRLRVSGSTVAIRKPGQRLLIVAACLLTTSTSARAGKNTDTFKQSAELAKRTSKTSEDVDKYVAQLDKTEEALSSVGQAQSKDLKKRYESFSRELNNLEDAQKHTTADIDEMKSTGAQYFAAWDASIAQMSDPGLKQASTERRSKVMKDHDELAATLVHIGSELQPFMSTLLDLKAFMGTDLSTENVGKAVEMIQKSQAGAQALKGQIAGVQTTLKQFLTEAPK
jgi:uncharacterized protein YoxC